MTKINTELLKKEGLSFEEIESVKRGLNDIKKGRTVPFENVKIKARKKMFSKSRAYV